MEPERRPRRTVRLDGRSKPHPGPEEPPRSDGRWSPKLDGFSQEDPDGSPVRSPRTGLKGPKKLEAQYLSFDAPLRVHLKLGRPSALFRSLTHPRCIHSRPHSACLRNFMRPPTLVTSPPAFRLASETVRLALRQPDLMLHPFRASFGVTGTS